MAENVPSWKDVANMQPDPADDKLMLTATATMETYAEREWGIKGMKDYTIALWCNRYWFLDKDRKILTEIGCEDHGNGFDSLDMAIGYALGKGWIV